MCELFISLGVCLMVDNDLYNLGLCVSPLDRKVGPTATFYKPCVIKFSTMVFWPIPTLILTKHNLITLVYTRTCDISFKMSKTQIISCCTIPHMSKVIFDCWHFLFYFCGANYYFWFHSIGVFISHCSPSKNFNTLAWGIYAISITTLLWPPCLNPFFHTKSILEKCDLSKFWT